MELLEALGINVPSLLLHTVNFLLLVAVLTKFLHRPVMKMLDERAARIKESMQRAEEIKDQLTRTSEETRAALASARKEGQSIIDQASQMAERLKAQARQDAQSEAEKIVEKARTEIDREREQAVVELRREMADLVVVAAGKVIGRTLDEKAHHHLVEEFLANGQRLNN